MMVRAAFPDTLPPPPCRATASPFLRPLAAETPARSPPHLQPPEHALPHGDEQRRRRGARPDEQVLLSQHVHARLGAQVHAHHAQRKVLLRAGRKGRGKRDHRLGVRRAGGCFMPVPPAPRVCWRGAAAACWHATAPPGPRACVRVTASAPAWPAGPPPPAPARWPARSPGSTPLPPPAGRRPRPRTPAAAWWRWPGS